MDIKLSDAYLLQALEVDNDSLARQNERLRTGDERAVAAALNALPKGFEPDPQLTVDQRLRQIEAELGFVPTAEDPLAQKTLLLRVIGLERRLAALCDHLGLRTKDLFPGYLPGIQSLGAPPVEP